MSSEPDVELVASANAGDRAALDALLRRHQDRVYALCRRMTGNDADARDAAQEALLAVCRGLPRFDGRSAFTTWLYRVTTNACLDELRRRGRRPVPIDHTDPTAPVQLLREPSSANESSMADAVGRRIDIDAALDTLPHEFRVAVVLRDLCELDYAEIAEVLDIPPGTVRSRIARGRAALAAGPREPDRPRRSSDLATMTTPDHARDELASAYLDDEVTSEERARVEADPTLQARVAELASGRDRVREITPLTDDQRDDLVAGVLRRLDEPAPLAGRRARRFNPASLVAAAAAVIAIGLFGGAIALLADGGTGSDEDSASAPESAITTAGSGADAPESSGGAADDSHAFSTEASGTAPFLGAFGSIDELAEQVRRNHEERRGSANPPSESETSDDTGVTPSDGDQARCGAPPDDAVSRAVLDGRQVLVIEPDGEAPAMVSVVDQATCALVATFVR